MQYIIDFFSNNLLQILALLHVLLALSLIGLIFVQQGKGSDVGASFGSGASNTMFGAQGSFSFLFKLTAILVFLFFVSNMVLNRWFIEHDATYKRKGQPGLVVTPPKSGKSKTGGGKPMLKGVTPMPAAGTPDPTKKNKAESTSHAKTEQVDGHAK